MNVAPIQVLLIEDNPGDARLTREALLGCNLKMQITEVKDGEQAIACLLREDDFCDAPTPDLILLDLNLPRKDGREVLVEIKANPNLNHIPVVVLTSSKAEDDILRAYQLHANCYITKPIDLEQLQKVATQIHEFWFTIAKLPQEAWDGRP